MQASWRFPFWTPEMKQPIDPLVSELVNRLDAGRREDFEERAAIIQFEAGYSRGHAECLALLDVLRRYPDVLRSITPSA